MVPLWLSKVFGQNWKTNLAGWMFAAAGFISATPQLWAKWPVVVAIANYVMVGSGAAGFMSARDSKKQ